VRTDEPASHNPLFAFVLHFLCFFPWLVFYECATTQEPTHTKFGDESSQIVMVFFLRFLEIMTRRFNTFFSVQCSSIHLSFGFLTNFFADDDHEEASVVVAAAAAALKRTKKTQEEESGEEDFFQASTVG
jgi:hypothetical protein